MNDGTDDKYICKLLREIAHQDSMDDGFPIAEHTCWIAAKRIEELNVMIDNQDIPKMLRRFADRIESV